MTGLLSCARIGVAVVALTVPIGATAATINADLSANENFTDGFTLSVGDTQRYNFSVLTDLVISAFAVSGTSTGDVTNLANVTFGLTDPPEDSFDSVQTVMGVSGANDFVPGATFRAGEMFSFYFADGVISDVSLTLSFNTKSPDPTMGPEVVPVPAAGALLLTALVGGAAYARRKKRQA